MSDASTAAAPGDGAAAYDAPEWLSLEDGEELQWVGQPTTLRLVGTVVAGVVTIPIVVGVFVLLALPFQYLRIDHTDYVVTNRSLYVKTGILSTNIESVDLDRIQNTEFTQSFWGTRLGFGTIEISTAGTGGADVTFDDVEDARAVREELTRVQRAFAEGAGLGSGGTGGSGGRRPASRDQLDELVAELRATREALERVEAKLRDGQQPARDRTDGTADRRDGNR